MTKERARYLNAKLWLAALTKAKQHIVECQRNGVLLGVERIPRLTVLFQRRISEACSVKQKRKRYKRRSKT